ncbi:MAG: tRNA pseudouridine(13) synthase TruD [Halioglobus sp.]
MQVSWPRASGEPGVTACIRSSPEDFVVREQLGFELSGEGEHVFLHLEKTQLNTLELQEKLSRLSGVAVRDIGFCGMKDRNAVTRQWFSVGMAGKPEPDWAELEQAENITVLQVGRHLRKLKRGVHQANLFELRLRDLNGNLDDLESRLQRVAKAGVPNYFGEQRFGRGGQTLEQARRWVDAKSRKLTRTKTSLYLSALRSYLFNQLLAARVRDENWNLVADGDVCMLQGTRSRFSCSTCDEDIRQRNFSGDLHPALPLWGSGKMEASAELQEKQLAELASDLEIAKFLEHKGLELSYRSARLMADDFCWQFCDDGSLLLSFGLAPGGYATAVLAELVQFNNRDLGSRNRSE